MKEFYVVDGDNVRKATLRETPKFYIEDANGNKFKKIDGSEYIGSYRTKNDRWHNTTYYLYELSHKRPNEILEKNKRSMFAWKVKKAAEEKINNAKTYSDFIELNKVLNLCIDI